MLRTNQLGARNKSGKTDETAEGGFSVQISWAPPNQTSSIVWSSRTCSQNFDDKVWPKVAELSSAARHWPFGPGNDSNLRNWASLPLSNSDSGPHANALPHTRTTTPANNIQKA